MAQLMKYVPILKAKLGEFGALKQVPAVSRDRIFPILECLPMKWTDPELRKSLAAHLDRMAKAAVKACGGTWPIGIDTSLLLPAYPSQGALLAAACARLKGGGLTVVPCIRPSIIGDTKSLSRLSTYPDVILRLEFRNFLAGQITPVIDEIFESIADDNCQMHVVLDIESQVGAEPKALALSVSPLALEAMKSKRPSTVTIAGGSFPAMLTGLSQGQSSIPRVEWQTWRRLIKNPELSDLQFGDYAVTNPDLPDLPENAVINASAAIRYAREDHWMLIKGTATRTGGFAQYNGLCKILVGEKYYSGPAFSYGDQQYANHTAPGAKSGNLTTWRRDATSHHLALTVDEYATLI